MLGIGVGLTKQLSGSSKAAALASFGNLTFFKDYAGNRLTLDADLSAGVRTSTFTSARSASAPATYTDSNGIIQLVTSANTPRYQGGYYDTTGFHAQSGLMIEAEGTNLIPKSYTMNDATWDATNVTVADGAMADPAGGTNAASLTASNTNGTVLLHTAVTASTYSVFLKRKTGTGAVSITADGTNYTTVTLTSSWARYSVTATSASQICGIKIASNSDAVYVYGNQFENNPYATSLIPTTTAALTRPYEALRYETSGNRTAASESIFIKFVAKGGDFSTVKSRILIDTSTARRLISGGVTTNKIYLKPNRTDSTAVISSSTTSIVANQSFVVAGVMKHSSPYSTTFVDGTDKQTYTAGDWTDPAFGTYSFIGSDNAYGNQLNGIIQSIAIYSDAKSDANVATITGVLNQ